METCYRHPDRETGVSCSSCGRPICPDCMTPTPVGMRCPECSKDRTKVRTISSVGDEPVVTYILIAINVLAFLGSAASGGDVGLGGTGGSVISNGALFGPSIAIDHEYWRLVTSGFLHIGPIHLLFNMMALWVLGRDVEMVLGRGRFLALYVISLLGGAAAVMLFYAPDESVAGASGAVFGLMGGLAVVLKRLRVPAGQVIGLIAVNVAISVLIPGISLIGHLGGLVVGAAATAALVYAPANRNQSRVQVAALGALTLLVLAVIAVTSL